MNISNRSAVATALIIGWVIFMIYHGDLPGFLWVLGIGGAQPNFCAGTGTTSAGSSGPSISVGPVTVGTPNYPGTEPV